MPRKAYATQTAFRLRDEKWRWFLITKFWKAGLVDGIVA
jgi:hypothetical protein